jgi:hypothetical protein
VAHLPGENTTFAEYYDRVQAAGYVGGVLDRVVFKYRSRGGPVSGPARRRLPLRNLFFRCRRCVRGASDVTSGDFSMCSEFIAPPNIIFPWKLHTSLTKTLLLWSWGCLENTLLGSIWEPGLGEISHGGCRVAACVRAVAVFGQPPSGSEGPTEMITETVISPTELITETVIINLGRPS